MFFFFVPLPLTNILKFTCLFKVEPSTKLFPAVFAQATSPNVFQFELGRIKVRKTLLVLYLGHFSIRE